MPQWRKIKGKLTRSANLALVRKDPEMRPLNSLLEIGIRKNQQRRLSACLQRNILQRPCSKFHDLFPRGSGSRKRNFIYKRMRDQRRASLFTVSINDIHHTGWKSRFDNQRPEDENTQRRLLSSFDNDCITAGESRTQLPRRHGQGIVPWDDLAYHTNGLTERIRELGVRRTDRLAERLVSPAAVVADCANGLDQVLVQCDLVGFSCCS